MRNQQNPDTSEYPLTCEEFAALNGVKAQSVRARICREGHYFGIRPRKLANRRTMFPAVQVAA